MWGVAGQLQERRFVGVVVGKVDGPRQISKFSGATANDGCEAEVDRMEQELPNVQTSHS